jgi:hypothetical protein
MIRLTDSDIVDIDGKKFTVAELKGCVIDSIMYRKRLQDMQNMEESL